MKVGLIGVGRLGRMYGEYLARRVPGVALVAVADLKTDAAEKFAREFGVSRWYPSHLDLLEDREVEAVAIVTSTSSHKQLVMDAAKGRKAVFCEKPISLTLEDAYEMMQTVEASGTFFQMAFQRRFDAGYLAAKRKLEAGAIGDPVLFSSISRDPYPPPIAFCDPKVSGGLIADMGVHDFDAARMYLGDVKSVHAIGATLAYPEMKSVGDIDNAIIDLVFQNGALGVVQLSRNAAYGYDIRGEIWGTKGSIQIGYDRQTPILMFTPQGITYDAVPYFMERFENAYLAQIQDFADHVRRGLPPSISGADAVAALRISLAANRSMRDARSVDVDEMEPERHRA